MAFVTLTNKDKAIKFLADPSSTRLEALAKEGWYPKEQETEPAKTRGRKKAYKETVEPTVLIDEDFTIPEPFDSEE